MSALNRVYVGRLSSMVRDGDLERIFKGYGKINDVKLKYGYAFVDFDSSRDADSAVKELDGVMAFGSRIQVQHAKGTPRGEDFLQDMDRGYRHQTHRRNDRPSYRRDNSRRDSTRAYRIIVKNLSSRVNWQDLKDLMRKVGDVEYVDAHRNKNHEGMVKFNTRREADKAIEKYNGYELHGRKLELFYEDKELRHGSSEGSRSRSGSRRRSSRRRRSAGSDRSRSGSYDRKRRADRDSESLSPKRKRRSADRKNRSRSAERKNRSRSAERKNRSRSGSNERKKNRSRSGSTDSKNDKSGRAESKERASKSRKGESSEERASDKNKQDNNGGQKKSDSDIDETEKKEENKEKNERQDREGSSAAGDAYDRDHSKSSPYELDDQLNSENEEQDEIRSGKHQEEETDQQSENSNIEWQ